MKRMNSFVPQSFFVVTMVVVAGEDNHVVF
jgi:hypothetical protein